MILMVLALGCCGALADEKVIVTGQPEHHWDPDEVICKKGDPPAGSRIGRGQVCHTAARWKSIKANSDDDLRAIQDRDAWNIHLNGP